MFNVQLWDTRLFIYFVLGIILAVLGPKRLFDSCYNLILSYLSVEELQIIGLKRPKRDMQLWMQSFMGILYMLSGEYWAFHCKFVVFSWIMHVLVLVSEPFTTLYWMNYCVLCVIIFGLYCIVLTFNSCICEFLATKIPQHSADPMQKEPFVQYLVRNGYPL